MLSWVTCLYPIISIYFRTELYSEYNVVACLRALAAEVHVALIIDKPHGAESFRYQLSLISRRYCSHFLQADETLLYPPQAIDAKSSGLCLEPHESGHYTYSLLL